MSGIKRGIDYDVVSIAAEESSALVKKFDEFASQLKAGLNSSELSDYQTQVTKHLLVQMAAIMPLASIGTCHCGHEMRYKGKVSALYVCCSGNPEHCWRIA